MIYKTFTEWKNGNWLEDGEPRKEAYTKDELLLLDICNVSWGDVIDTRLGRFAIEKGMFTEIIANDVLEHIPDLVKAMTNCRDLLKRGGEMHIHVPYDLSYGAWQDPTHVRAFNENSFLYYTDLWYRDWETDRKSTRLNSSHRL